MNVTSGARLGTMLAAFDEPGRQALREIGVRIEVALRNGDTGAALGASKDIVESAARSALASLGEPDPPRGAPTPRLVEAAFAALGIRTAAQGEIGQGLSMTVRGSPDCGILLALAMAVKPRRRQPPKTAYSQWAPLLLSLAT